MNRYYFFLATITFTIVIGSCKKLDLNSNASKSYIMPLLDPIRYRDSVFSSVDTSTFFNIMYRVANNKGISDSLKFDAYLPAGDTATKRPAIIFIHGGGFGVTEYTRKDPDIKYFCEQMAKRGYVVISPSYRLGVDWHSGQNNVDSSSKYYEEVYKATQDIRACVRYIKLSSAIGKLDSTKIFIGGESAGSVTAINAAYLESSEVPTYFVDSCGVLDGTGLYDWPGYSNKVKGVINVEGAIIDTSFIDLGNAPMINFYGSLDTLYWGTVIHPYYNVTIPLFNGQRIQTRLSNLNIVPSPTNVYSNGVHGDCFNNPANKLSTISSVSNWLYERIQ